ncbi:MAG: AI-2E family transporter [Eubacteriales bacterium]|nr:AI-2E family transporter [Eubacteriales bacterium]
MNEKWRDYFYKGAAVFLTVAMCILFFFVVFRFREFQGYLGMVAGILMPFIYGAVIAYLLSPVCSWLELHMEQAAELSRKPEKTAEKYRRLFKGLSILISLLLFCLVIYALIAMVVPQVINSVLVLAEAMPGYVQKISAWVEELVQDNPVLVNYVEQYSEDIMNSVQDFARTHLIPNINNVISGVSASLWTMITMAKNFVIGLIVAVYLMNSRKAFRRQAGMMIRALFPDRKIAPGKEQRADWIIRELHILNAYLGGFVKGKLVDSLIIGLICMAFTAITKMPYAVLVSVVVGVTNIIPFFGPFIGAIPSAILILMVSPIQCVYFVIFVLILQQFDGNILGPKILGDTTHLNSFWVLFAILLFGGLFGIVGMVIGVPVFAFFYQLVREWMYARLGKDEKPVDSP